SYHPTRVLDAGESIERAIYAMEPWNDTGIYLEKGKNYEFIADGEWLDRTIPCGPAGTSDGIFHVAEVAHIAGSLWGKIEETFKWLTGNESADFKATKRVEEIPWFCLVGAIANSGNPAEDGTPIPSEIFRIGKERKYTPLESGYLYCFANDAWNFYDNNRGSVSLITKCL
ncbi:MAG: DUF2235 domain-containing protein, partial [Gammaproteobacteria bacterium]|nr:DUF2235 domain-containing protein [Gammaproteobacteria bacterium]